MEPNEAHPEPTGGTSEPETVARLTKDIESYREQITSMEKLADLGKLTAGILHEIKNPVNFVNNFSRLSIGLTGEMAEIVQKSLSELTDDDLLDLKEVSDALSKNVSKINENGKRIERIIQGMLAQTRSDGPHFEVSDLNNLIEENTKLAYQSLRGEDSSFNVSLEFKTDPAIGEVRVAVNELGRVILNLASNSCYAINERLRRNEPGYVPLIRATTEKSDGQVTIRMYDNGIGIPEDIVAKLFQPFFTTKPPGKGTGLGLALTYASIVETHKGSINVSSVFNDHTEFTIVLPL